VSALNAVAYLNFISAFQCAKVLQTSRIPLKFPAVNEHRTGVDWMQKSVAQCTQEHSSRRGNHEQSILSGLWLAVVTCRSIREMSAERPDKAKEALEPAEGNAGAV
jgi:hypothetical protein